MLCISFSPNNKEHWVKMRQTKNFNSLPPSTVPLAYRNWNPASPVHSHCSRLIVKRIRQPHGIQPQPNEHYTSKKQPMFREPKFFHSPVTESFMKCVFVYFITECDNTYLSSFRKCLIHLSIINSTAIKT